MEAAQASDEQAGKQSGQGRNELSKASASDRRVEEVVLISATKEILYQRSAPEADKRATLLDWLAHCSAGVGQTFTSLGRLDRLEIRDTGSRVICLFQPDNKIFVRLSVTPRKYADAVNESSCKSWMEKAGHDAIVFACGLRLSNHSCSVQTRHKAYPEAGLNELLQRLSEIIATLRNCRLGSSRLRWVFEHGQIRCAHSADATIAFVVTSNDPGVAPAMEELFGDLSVTVPAGPELSGQAA
jgi:hypothetical protein